jgi:hypothetical protein
MFEALAVLAFVVTWIFQLVAIAKLERLEKRGATQTQTPLIVPPPSTGTAATVPPITRRPRTAESTTCSCYHLRDAHTSALPHGCYLCPCPAFNALKTQESIARGVAQAEAGKFHDLGSFAPPSTADQRESIQINTNADRSRSL